MNTYIFLTSGGTTQDDAGNDIENNQHVGTAKGETALDAFNNLNIAGDFDSVFCYQLVDDKICGSFDCLPPIPAECEDEDCSACELPYEVRKNLDCPFLKE